MNDYYEQIGALPHRPHLVYVYVTGFLVSVISTLAAYALVASHAIAQTGLIACIVVLALIQCVVQAICFLHVSAEKGSRLKLLILCAALVVVGILVSGSLWIMLTLNSRMMPSPDQMQQYMQDQGGF
jgi:cytochrome o ubiquinol oxidase operon protein cyoD